MLRTKAVGVAATATEPEGGACSDGSVKEPPLDKVGTLETEINV